MATLILLATFAAATPSVPAASFDCARASSLVEQMICADPALRGIDRGIALFYASGHRNARPARVLREQRDWLTATRDRCDSAACLRAAMSDRLWQLSEAVGPDLPAYVNDDADGELVIVPLEGGWYAFGATGYWHGPTENSAAAAGAFRLEGDRGSVAPASEEDCSFSLIRLPGDRWRLASHPHGEVTLCGGMNATVDGLYSRSLHR